MADKCQICKKTVAEIKKGMFPFFDCQHAKNRMHVFNGKALDFTDDEKKKHIVDYVEPTTKIMTYEAFMSHPVGKAVEGIDRNLLTSEAMAYLFFIFISDAFDDNDEYRLGKEVFAEKFPQLYNMIFTEG